MYALDVPVRDGFWDLRGVLDRGLRYWPPGVKSLDISSSNIEFIRNMPNVREFVADHSKIATLVCPKSLKVLSCAHSALEMVDIPEGAWFVNLEGCSGLTKVYAPDSVEYLNIDDCSGIKDISVSDNLKVLSANYTGLKFQSLPFHLEEYHAIGCGFALFESLPLNMKVLRIDAVENFIFQKWVIPRSAYVEIGNRLYREEETPEQIIDFVE